MNDSLKEKLEKWKNLCNYWDVDFHRAFAAATLHNITSPVIGLQVQQLFLVGEFLDYLKCDNVKDSALYMEACREMFSDANWRLSVDKGKYPGVHCVRGGFGMWIALENNHCFMQIHIGLDEDVRIFYHDFRDTNPIPSELNQLFGTEVDLENLYFAVTGASREQLKEEEEKAAQKAARLGHAYVPYHDTLTKEEVAELQSATEDKGLFVRLDKEEYDAGPFNKVNFVDSNNRLIGYDLIQDCCEWADWRFAWLSDLMIPCKEKEHEGELDAEHTYIEKVKNYLDGEEEVKVTHKIWFYPGVFFADEKPEIIYYKDGGGEARWRLVDKENKFVGKLILENNHNGYYCHSFTDINNGELFECESL